MEQARQDGYSNDMHEGNEITIITNIRRIISLNFLCHQFIRMP